MSASLTSKEVWTSLQSGIKSVACALRNTTLELLTELTEELERRKQLLKAAGLPNIDHYNAAT